MYRYDIVQYLAFRYKLLAKFLFIVQLLLSWVTVFISTLYAASYLSDDDSTDNQPAEGVWWIVSGSRTISSLGDTAFFLTVVASFLISFDSYINAKVRAKFEQSLCQTTMFTGCCIHPRSSAFPLPPPHEPRAQFTLSAGALAAVAVVRGLT